MDASRVLAEILQLVRRAAGASDLETLGFVMVNESRQVLEYQLAVFWRQAGAFTDTARLSAVSGQPRPDPNSPFSHWVSGLCHRLSEPASEVSKQPRLIHSQDHPDLSQDWAQWLPPHVMWVPLLAVDGEQLGGWLLARAAPWQPHELAVVQELGTHYGLALANKLHRRRGKTGGTRWWWQHYRRWVWGAVLVFMFIPIRQSVILSAEVRPDDPYFVRAPMDGVIDRLLVKPNQTVEAGAALLTLDESALKARHEVARKVLDAAREEFRQSAQLSVTDDRGRLEMALRRGVLEEKSIEFDFLTEQLGRVQIRAPRAGVVVFSGADQWLGRTVVQGERILLLADPARIELVVRLPVGERFDITEGTVVTLYPNASPLSSYGATVKQVAYSAELDREGLWSYQIQANFDPDQPLPRIGTTGSARIRGDWVPLSFFALRRPLTVLRQTLGI
ncbi:efflux RND transporter periplasmic adaptor subunit [Desulfofustis glycolicus]|uniref:GAF domain-containing protein n=1 Tax=Desulfofustis glycolicus DSM 9705 TaxID=1121409 RepID=A0A1M5YEK9_9BACT|nr:HlyD family efflux transporter periplasmic adaptor subunit [Desulfofustis glycolicus]MCB2215229.1 HlyD family efflux transporter periplasmic adaptor subunit [Desulfobulbaceae bacterium]SHI10465.1 GAF domain-containing protein [Desulfofustis glycolicus DSM 9705]